MIKHKDNVSMDYLQYLKIVLANKRRKRKRLERDLDIVVREIIMLEEGIRPIEEWHKREEEKRKERIKELFGSNKKDKKRKGEKEK